MKVYLMSVMDENYSYIFKCKYDVRELFKRFSESGKLVRVGDFIVNKERLKEIKDITYDGNNKIEEIQDIEFSKYNNILTFDDIVIREQCDIDRIAKELSNRINKTMKLSENIQTVEFPIYKPTMVIPEECSDAVFLRNILSDEIKRIENGTSNKETLGWIVENINEKLIGLKGW